MASGKAKKTKASKELEGKPDGWKDDAALVQKHGIQNGQDAYAILRGLLERQGGQNDAEDGTELYLFCEAFKALDEHMRTASGSGPTEWRNR